MLGIPRAPASLPSSRTKLNARREEVRYYVSMGFRNAEIGAALGISESTVKGYVAQLLVAFGAANRTELVGMMLPSGSDAGRRMDEIRRLARP